MDREEFMTIVQEDAGIGPDEAERAVRATLETLGERISQGARRDLVEQLPPEIGPWVNRLGDQEAFDPDEFLARVARREGVGIATAQLHVRAVFTAMQGAVSPKELGDLASELPKGLWPVLPRGPQLDVMPSDEFVLRVAERAGLDEDPARRATEAVLETLAERIAGGEVEDLLAHLAVELHPPLRNALQRTGGRPARLSLDEFVQRVAARETTTVLDAGDHTRAVFQTLHEAVGDEEFHDVRAELPTEFSRVLSAR